VSIIIVHTVKITLTKSNRKESKQLASKDKLRRQADQGQDEHPDFYNDQLGENATEYFGEEYDNKRDKRRK